MNTHQLLAVACAGFVLLSLPMMSSVVVSDSGEGFAQRDNSGDGKVTANDENRTSSGGNGKAKLDDTASESTTSTIEGSNGKAKQAAETIDLELNKVVNNTQPTIGDSITVQVTIRNTGEVTATNVSVNERLELPTGIEYTSDSPSQGTYDPATGVWTVGRLSGGTSATLELIVRVKTTEEVYFVSQVLTADQDDPDSNPGNNLEEDDQTRVVVQPKTEDREGTSQPSTAQTTTTSQPDSGVLPDEGTGTDTPTVCVYPDATSGTA